MNKQHLSVGSVTPNDKLARLAGLLYVLTLPTTGLWYGITSSLLVSDPAATLANIQASRDLFEVAIVVGAFGRVVQLVLVLVLYRLFSPVSQVAASLVLAFIAVSVPLELAAVARQIDLLSLVDGAQGVSALGADQLQVQVMLTMHSYNSLFLASIIFWGLWLFPLGWLVLRCGFIPRVLGVLIILGGPFYLLTFAGSVFDPGYQNTLFARIVGIASGIPDLIGEGGTALWLLIMGARERKTVVR
jgi:hypothetical protein